MLSSNDPIFQLTVEQLKKIVKESIKEELSNSDSFQKEEKILNAKQAASFLNVSAPTIHKWKKENVIPFHRKGGRIYFIESELVESILQSKKQYDEK